jgi:hypothetical protein
MTWFDIIKGKYISSKKIKILTNAILEVKGVTVTKVTTSKKQHLQFYCVYNGPDSPDRKPVKFIITTGGHKATKNVTLMKKNVKRALERKGVYIGEW